VNEHTFLIWSLYMLLKVSYFINRSMLLRYLKSSTWNSAIQEILQKKWAQVWEMMRMKRWYIQLYTSTQLDHWGDTYATIGLIWHLLFEWSTNSWESHGSYTW